MRTPKKGKKKAPASAAGAGGSGAMAMDTDAPQAAPQQPQQPTVPTVWRPGVDPLEEGEELDYDPTAYDCLHRFTLEWPCLSFDLLRDDLGGPRSAFPHTMYMIAGTQAANPRQNYLAVLKLAALGQGPHGKKKAKATKGGEGDDESDGDSGSESEEEEGSSSDGMDDSDDEGGKEEPPRLHCRLLNQGMATNRLRAMPQRPGLVAMWGDAGQVRLLDATQHLQELAEEAVQPKATKRVQVNPLQVHSHATEGFALDWSPVQEGRLASGDCKKHIHVWEPAEAGRWQVSAPYNGHTASVEDLQWSPTEATVFASASCDKTIRVWDTRERAKPMLSVEAHDADVNVISWNRLVTYMLASGGDDGSLRIWDLRAFSSGGHVSHFAFHRGHISSVEWSPYESSMLATAASDNQVVVWDLALERDPEEEAALVPEGSALPPEDLPPQLLFVHAGQRDVKELHWHAQIPGMLVSTAADGFNVFRPSNL